MVVIHIREDNANNSKIRSKARDTMIETDWDVEANVVRDWERQIIVCEASVDAEEDITVSVLEVKVSDNTEKNARITDSSGDAKSTEATIATTVANVKNFLKTIMRSVYVCVYMLSIQRSQ